VAGAKKNVRRGKRNQKSLQATATTGTRSNFFLAVQRRKLHLKVTSWGGGKCSQLIETPHFSFVPSLAASCVGVFLFFGISKLENLAIKLVEIALEKHKFPNFHG
jgi:hypothetical protein